MIYLCFMGAIFGQCNTNSRPVDASEMNLMLTQLNHWNADDKNIWISGNMGLGHLMLYNTPESLHEKLPYYEPLARLTITADARIDNRNELFALLDATTPDEKSMPDSRLILLAYKKYGTDCTRHLVGDFAFAITDEINQIIFCARDQMGVKPFFYSHRNDLFAFASEKKGLLCLAGFDATINKQYFYNQWFIQSIQAAYTTLYQHIHKLRPGHSLILTIARNKIEHKQYWTLDANTELKLPKKEDYYEGLRYHFEEAVKCRLRTSYPLGIELSGGMDSSSITGVASHFLKNTGRPITTFTNDDSDESLPFTLERGGSEKEFAQAVIDFNKIERPVFITKQISENPLDGTFPGNCPSSKRRRIEAFERCYPASPAMKWQPIAVIIIFLII
jgi:asparagine synthase (glutamine-hydrolysing)